MKENDKEMNETPTVVEFQVLSTLRGKVIKAFESMDKEMYPEGYGIIDRLLNGGGDIYYSCMELADALYNSDIHKPMDRSVADIIIAIYKDEINDGNAEAMNNLGSLYYRGRLGEPDYVKARKYYQMAAKTGYITAVVNLAYIYYYGLEVKTDYKKAYHLFMQAFIMGHDEAAYKLGDMYRYGYYVEANPQLAFQMYVHAMSFKSVDGEGKGYKCIRMADCLFEGIGIDIDYERALEMYQKAEIGFYQSLKEADPYCRQYLEKAIARQKECREKIDL